MCAVESCERTDIAARGWCRLHYQRWYYRGDPLAEPKRAPLRKCAAEGCQNTIAAVKRNTNRSGRKRYCSLECYRATPVKKVIPKKVCDHCAGEYQPTGTRQSYCSDCLGPPNIKANGRPDYPGWRSIHNYGVSYSEVQSLKARFDGACWICRTDEATHIDHDHDTGKVRGVLCSPCNTALRRHVSVEWMQHALDYLEG